MKNDETVKTLSVLALAALVFYFITRAAWLPPLAAALLALGTFDNPAGRAVARGWLKFGHLLGSVNSKVLLFLIYYLVLTPTAFVYRLFNPSAADHFRRCPEGSLFQDIPPEAYSRESFEKPW